MLTYYKLETNTYEYYSYKFKPFGFILSMLG